MIEPTTREGLAPGRSATVGGKRGEGVPVGDREEGRRGGGGGKASCR
jgi:hypothetical protein